MALKHLVYGIVSQAVTWDPGEILCVGPGNYGTLAGSDWPKYKPNQCTAQCVGGIIATTSYCHTR